jgi:hypothetical protein
MHPYIMQALMDERGRELHIEARAESRLRRLLRGQTR